jgi:hypothetical protein
MLRMSFIAAFGNKLIATTNYSEVNYNELRAQRKLHRKANNKAKQPNKA